MGSRGPEAQMPSQRGQPSTDGQCSVISLTHTTSSTDYSFSAPSSWGSFFTRLLIFHISWFFSFLAACMHAQLLQLSSALWDPHGLYSPPGSSMEFSWQEYWRGFPCPPLVDLSHPGIELMSPAFPALQADSLLLSHLGSTSNLLLVFFTENRFLFSLESPGLSLSFSSLSICRPILTSEYSSISMAQISPYQKALSWLTYVK